jgi:hypothetical protein
MPTFTRYDAVGAREDLSDVIYDISPQDTPIMSSIGKTKATAVFHEWQTALWPLLPLLTPLLKAQTQLPLP